MHQRSVKAIPGDRFMPPGKGLGQNDGMDRLIMSGDPPSRPPVSASTGDLQSPSAGSAQGDASTGSVDSAPAPQQGSLHLLHHQASTESSTGSGGLEPPPAPARPRRSPPRPHQSGGHAGRADPDPAGTVRRRSAHSRWLDGPGSTGRPCSTPQPRQTRRLSDLMLCCPDADSGVSPLHFSRRLAAKHRPGPGVAGSSPAGASSLADVSEPGHAPSEQYPGRVSSPASRPKLGGHASPGRATALIDRPSVARGNARGLRPTARDNSRHGSPGAEEQQEQPAAGTLPSGLRQGSSSAVIAVQATAVLTAVIEESEARESPRQRPRSGTGQAQAVPAAGAAELELQEGLRKRPHSGKQSSLGARSLATQLEGPRKRPCCSRQSLPGALPHVQSLSPERSSPGASSSGGSGKQQRSAAGPHSRASTRQRQVGLLHAAGSALPVAARELQQLPRADAVRLCGDAPTAGSKSQQRQGSQPKAGSAVLQVLAPAASSNPQRKLADLSTAGSSNLQRPGREPQQWPADLPTAGSSTLQGGAPAAAEIPQSQPPMARWSGPPSSSSLPGQRPPLVTRTSQPKRSLPMRLKSSTQLHALPAPVGGALSRAASPEAADGCGSWQWEHCAGSNSPEPGHGASRQQQEAAVAAEQRRAAAAATAVAAEKKRVAEAAALVAEQRRAAAAQAQQQREKEDRFLEALNQVCPSWRICDAAPAVEPERAEGQWDYMLEEARWLAADFAQERLWKQAASRSLAHACARSQHSQRLRRTSAACLADVATTAEREAVHARERAQRGRSSWQGVCVEACVDRCSLLHPCGGTTCSSPHPADRAPLGQPAEPALTYCASRDLPVALAQAAKCAEVDCIIERALACHQHAEDVAEAIAEERAGQEEELAAFLAELRAPQLHPDCYSSPAMPVPTCKACRPAPERWAMADLCLCALGGLLVRDSTTCC